MCSGLSDRRAGSLLRSHSRDLWLRRGLVPARSDRAPVLHVLLAPRRPHDDALRERPRRSLVDDARGWPRAVRARHRRVPREDTARRLAVARTQRVAEPDVGEPRGPQPSVLAALVRTAARDVPGP